MLDLVLGTIIWVVVPAIIVVMHIFRVAIYLGTKDYQLRASAWSGYGIGWLLLIVSVATLKPFIPSAHSSFDPLHSFDPLNWLIWIVFGGGIALAFGLLSALPTRRGYLCGHSW